MHNKISVLISLILFSSLLLAPARRRTPRPPTRQRQATAAAPAAQHARDRSTGRDDRAEQPRRTR